jgi:Flp pilus assembly protein TadD
LELAKTAHNLAPDDTEITHTLGKLAYQAEDYRWSLSLLQESARKAPDQPQMLYDLGLSYYSLGRVAEAEASMQSALKLDDTFAQADAAKHFLSMMALTKNPDKARAAAAEIQNTLKSAPHYVPALMVSAIICEQENRIKEAKETYEAILARTPLFVPAAKRLATLYAENLRDDKKAFEVAKKAREMYPDDPELTKILGIIIYRRGDYAWSAQLLKESARKNATDPNVFYYLGMAQYHMKEIKESVETLRKALALNLNKQFADEAKRVIAASQQL